MIVTLLSDFGNKDNAVAITKGLLLKHNPEAMLIDLSHETTPYNLLQCSYLLKSAYNNFPEQTIHLCMFDIMQLTPAHVLVGLVDDQIILSADNGMFPFSFPDKKIVIYRYDKPATNYLEWISNAALLLQEMNKYDLNFSKLNLTEWKPVIEVKQLRPVIKEDVMECQVIHIDRFGNVVLNVHRDEFESVKGDRNFSIRIPRNVPITKISQNYNEVSEGERLCLFNSAGYLEIAIREGSAAQLFGLGIFKKDQLIYNIIPIVFI